MQKILVPAIIVVLLLAGGVYFFLNSKKAPAPTAQTGSQVKEEKNAFTSIKDIFAKDISMECSFSDEKGMKTVAYIKAGAVRADVTGNSAAESGSVIYKDNKMYFWNNKEGIMMQLSQEDFADAAADATGKTSTSGIAKELEKYKDSCKPAVVSSDLFIPPATVKFTDYSEMMKNVKNGAMPSIDVKQYEQYMQKESPTSSEE